MRQLKSEAPIFLFDRDGEILSLPLGLRGVDHESPLSIADSDPHPHRIAIKDAAFFESP